MMRFRNVDKADAIINQIYTCNTSARESQMFNYAVVDKRDFTHPTTLDLIVATYNPVGTFYRALRKLQKRS